LKSLRESQKIVEGRGVGEREGS